MHGTLTVEGIDEESVRASRMSAGSVPAWHQPVMGAEILRTLNPRAGSIVVDGTVGTGGHSLMVAPRLLPDGKLIAIDRDRSSLEQARNRLIEFAPCVSFVHGSFRDLPELLASLGISRVDGLLLDLGMSSVQVDDATRGFSFASEGPLDMRMDVEQELTAQTLVNELDADELARIIRTFGEERYAQRIARRIVEARRTRPITTTTQLSHIISQAVPPAARHERIHSATRTFQAIRIAVNDELGALEHLLEHLGELLAPGGRAIVLSFHSLEDRLVKRAFAQGMRDELWTVLTKKPLRPTDDEITQNPRARSAKLRAIERREHP